MEENKRKQDLEDEMTRFEQEIATNLPPPPKLPQFPGGPLNPGMGGPPMLNGPPRPPFMPPHRMKVDRNMPFRGPPPVPSQMFMDGLPPMPVPPVPPMPPMMVPPMIPPPILPPVQPINDKIAPPTVPLKNYETVPTSCANDFPESNQAFMDPMGQMQMNMMGQQEPPVTTKKKEKKKVIRVAGGTVWEDSSLLDWDNNDFRIFVGDLGNEVSDDALLRAFSKYPSLLKARVIRDKKTKKTKGYGFVSFKEPQDYLKAMREMNGKYVGNRPIKLRKSTWKDRNIHVARKKEKEKKKLGLR